MRECVAAFIIRDKKILLGKRSGKRDFYPNIWDVFGGHQFKNESLQETLKRELREELGITPTNFEFLLTIEEPDPSANGSGKYHFYLVREFSGEPGNLQPAEHDFIEWFDFAEAINLPFADVRYAEMIKRIFNKDHLGNCLGDSP